MSYINDYIAGCPSFGWEGGPEFSTQIVSLMSGRERRNAQWAQARHKYTLPFSNITPREYAGIKQMHLACRGRLNGFRFRDELDYSVEDEVFATGDGAEVSFQLLKQSTRGGVHYLRRVFAIADGEVYANGERVFDFQVDSRRGVVTFPTPPAAGVVLSWSGVFDVWVRFDQDDLPFSIDNAGSEGYFINGAVRLIEIAPPGLGE
jgi:uncharacterized protein (TIGR02217 family)